MRVCVGFFGLNRSARFTARSIRRRMIAPLRQAGLDVRVVAHFNWPDVLHHTWSGERNVTPRDDSALLGLDLERIERQDEANIADMLPSALSVPWRGRADPDGGIRRGMLHQLHSLRRLADILDEEEGVFDVYVLLRADLKYFDPILPDHLVPILDGTADLATADYETWGGLNDRFAFCNRTGAEVFMRRWRRLDSFCARKGFIHSEMFLADAVAASGIRAVTTSLRAARVRSSGLIAPEDFPISKFQRTSQRIHNRLRIALGLAP